MLFILMVRAGLRAEVREMLMHALRIPETVLEYVEEVGDLKLPEGFTQPKAVVFAGMGGSAISGDVVRCWLRDVSPVPLETVRGYHLPAYVGPGTLVVAVSYSGQTEETISAFSEAVDRGCMTVSVSSGGILRELSESLGVPWIAVPRGLQPRAAFPQLLTAETAVLEAVGVPGARLGELVEACRELLPLVPRVEAEARRVADGLFGRLPVVYSHEGLWPAALRFKTQLNENSKVPAKVEFLPELCHNEVVGLEGPGELLSGMAVVLLRDPGEEPPIRERVEAVKELLDGRVGAVLEFWAPGSSRIARLLSAVLFGDVVSVYLASMYGVDPTEVRSISLIKQRLKKLGVVGRVFERLTGRTLSESPPS